MLQDDVLVRQLVPSDQAPSAFKVATVTVIDLVRENAFTELTNDEYLRK
jgi:hypothetical protein